MILVRLSPTSPFVRKIRIAVAHLGLDNQVRFVTPEEDVGEAMRARNPLNKVPVAVLDDGMVVFDSPVLLEMVDILAGGGKIIPTEFKARMRVLTMQALADGILEAAVLIGYETQPRYRDEGAASARWIAHQQKKVDQGIAYAEQTLVGGPIDVGQITLACALDFVSARLGDDWRGKHAKLVAWLDDFAARVPSYAATKPGK